MMIQMLILVAATMLAAGDAWSTWRALRLHVAGTYESSPLGRFYIGDGAMPRLLAFKALLAAFFFYALFGHATGWVDILRWGVIAVMFAGEVYVVWSNVRFIRQNGGRV